ncbi:hypothetical protein [Aquimarina litoralis]|uniref:hypothetical protein n=1 Tax=Aquimarina litoralis TaxID=584605 RepID=UPI001C5A054F|nr:hypothetical protein [Aquimarina litoralis]MBW1294475.1 hypothetical protein [Aquimarina litoralis]
MKKKFLSKIKDARLLNKEESKTISGGYGNGNGVGPLCGLPLCKNTYYNVSLPNCSYANGKVFFGQTHFNSTEYCEIL